jgi:1-deoxy-D-xylulose-5-phosphate synthase
VLLENIESPSDIKHFNSDQLLQLCKELSGFYANSISKTGGHLGAALGVLELTVAIHYVFDTPRDKLIWDVGHQAHIHKILTGRRDKFMTLKQENGISGFTKRSESIYDPFGAGHSSTSISAALGMEVGRLLQNKDNKVIAVIGDGAMTAGMAYEALNNAGSLKNRLIVILNDNRMSISPTVGALTSHLAKLVSSNPHIKVKDLINSSLDNFSTQSFFKKALEIVGKKNKSIGSNLFENLGFHYLGPIDGHRLDDLIAIFDSVKNNTSIDKPILIHTLTKKGNGFYSPNGGEEEAFHAVNKFCSYTNMQCKPKSKIPTYTKVFTDSLIREANKDDNIVAITAAMPSGAGLDLFQKKFPKRFFDVGIAEQHAVTFAAGLACENMNPFVAIYSTFLQRSYDQIVHDIALQKLPVKFAIDRAGLVGGDGATHAGSFDLAFLGALPNFVIMSPSDENELSKMVATAALYDEGPIAFRYPRNEAVGVKIESEEILDIGKGRIIREGDDIAILSLGTRLQESLKAADILLERYGVSSTVADARFVKPIDTNLIKQLTQNHKLLITIEEGSIGGFSAQVNNFILQNNFNKNIVIRNLFLPDIFIDHGNVYKLYEQFNLNASAIINLVTELFNLSNVTLLKQKIS